MQNDKFIGPDIRHNHCSFMAKVEKGISCRKPYSVTRICNLSSLPLPNSQYATIRDHDGVLYLYLETIGDRMPSEPRERVELPKDHQKALEIIDKHMMYWPKPLVHKTKQRLTKMIQMRIRTRKLEPKSRPRPRKHVKRGQKDAKAIEDERLTRQLLAFLRWRNTRPNAGPFTCLSQFPISILNKFNLCG